MANDIKLAGTRRKSLTTMMAALLAGSIAATAGGVAYAKTDGRRSIRPSSSSASRSAWTRRSAAPTPRPTRRRR